MGGNSVYCRWALFDGLVMMMMTMTMVNICVYALMLSLDFVKKRRGGKEDMECICEFQQERYECTYPRTVFCIVRGKKHLD